MRSVNRLLIANRGEIAVRIARTARRMGIATVAVCSDADRESPHVLACDSAVPIGGLAAADSYLLAGRIIEAALSSGAHAVHPGYGFLSENAEFAAAVDAAGLVFVGPPAAAIHAMGDKARARRRMSTAGIEVVPGYDGEEQSEQRLVEESLRIGLPLMVKAAAGGGGRGMRLVLRREQLEPALRSAASEALKSFGDARLVLERAVVEPRHVEIQIMADALGQVIHLGERDCSVQRRHQKVVEEAPSPAVDDALRARMGQAAVRVAREIGYVGAGTVEFLLDPTGHFYFMEMNTRLQVEHPVTELVTGLDLVELQLRIARGEPLPLTQEEVRWTGSAIEVRLCAEDPVSEFLPCSGRVLDWSEAPLVRNDHAVAAGMDVSPWYDSMLAKIIAHGSTRTEAVDRLAGALDRSTLLGVTTNRVFLGQVLRHPVFVAGRHVSTAFIERHFPEPLGRTIVPDLTVCALAGWLSVAAAPEALCVPERWRGFSSGMPLPVPFRLEQRAAGLTDAGSASVKGHVRVERGTARVDVDGQSLRIEGTAVRPRVWGQVSLEGKVLDYRYAWNGDELWLQAGHGDYVFRCRRRAATQRADAGGTAEGVIELRAAMNARVVEVCAAPGQSVAKGQAVLVLEAMKMEHQMPARCAATVMAVLVKPGDQVSPGQLLANLEEQR